MHPQYKERNASHQLGGSFILMAYALTQSFDYSIRCGVVWCLGLALLAIVDPADGAVADSGLVHLAFVGCHWLLRV